jgi:hypothetical protein
VVEYDLGVVLSDLVVDADNQELHLDNQGVELGESVAHQQTAVEILEEVLPVEIHAELAQEAQVLCIQQGRLVVALVVASLYLELSIL